MVAKECKRRRKSRPKREFCYYCGAVLAAGERRAELDHAPIPDRHGGKDVIPACIICHDMKDRIPLDEWPNEWIQRIVDYSKNHVVIDDVWSIMKRIGDESDLPPWILLESLELWFDWPAEKAPREFKVFLGKVFAIALDYISEKNPAAIEKTVASAIRVGSELRSRRASGDDPPTQPETVASVATG